MRAWTVEIDDGFLIEIEQWEPSLRAELLDLAARLESGGPDALGFNPLEWEGFPGWDALGSPISLPIPISLRSGWKSLRLAILPDRRLFIVGLT